MGISLICICSTYPPAGWVLNSPGNAQNPGAEHTQCLPTGLREGDILAAIYTSLAQQALHRLA